MCLKPIVIEVHGQVPARIETVFDVFMPIDLTKIMQGYGPLPAVAAIEDQTGHWDSIGESRIIRLADGNAMLETLTAVDRPRGFSYTLSNPTHALRFLVSRFHGRWQFESVARDDLPRGEPEVVRVRWRYDFEPRFRLVRPIAALILARYWRPYMERALELAAREAVDAERGRVG